MGDLTILLTGATDGIGREAVKQLLGAGHRVVAHGRNEARLAELAREAGSALRPVRADFASLAEVRELVRELEQSGDTPDVLVNNAGVFMNEEVRTEDGFELTRQVGYLAPYLFTLSLLAGPAGKNLRRIVNVASDVHRHGAIDATDPGGRETPFDRLGSYASAKLGNVLFSAELARRLSSRGVDVTALHPGVVSTKLLTEGYGARGSTPVGDAGAAIVHLATSPELSQVTGAYFDLTRREPVGGAATDQALAQALYESTARLLDVAPI